MTVLQSARPLRAKTDPCAANRRSVLDGFPMARLDRLVVAAIVAAFAIGIGLLAPETATSMVGTHGGVAFLCIGTIGAVPLAFMMSRVKASFFGPALRVPRDTYAMPRWLIHLVMGAGMGLIVSYGVLSLAVDHRLAWLAGSFAIIFAAFFAGAWSRLKQHPKSEYEMRCWPPFDRRS